MSVELIASSVGKTLFPVVAKELIAKINSALNPTDLEKALKAGITAAEEWDATQPSEKHLFYRCDPKPAREFLERFFKDTGVQEELQKPFKDKTTLDIELLIKIFQKLASENKELKFLNKSIENWLEKFVNAYFEKTNTYLKFQNAKADYLKQLAQFFNDIKFVGLKVTGREDEKYTKLPQIFVMPDVVEQLENREIIPLQLNANVNQEVTVTQKQRTLLQQTSAQKFSAAQLLRESTFHKFVVLGEPGVGKTTLMSYFAVMLAEKQPEKLGLPADTELLPILIRIRELARYSEPNILEYVQHFAKNIYVHELPKGFFEYWLEDGRALILLDGLDEIAESGKRLDFVKRIESFLGQYSKNRAIITSRPAGYSREFFRTEELTHYTLEKFDDSQIELFIKQWYESRTQDYEEAQRRQESLKKALAEQERIKLLARNPLLLTIIALIHRYEASLPRQRYKLYERAVETLLINWDQEKGIDAKMSYLNNCDDIEVLMRRLAYWIHTQGATGDKDGDTLIDKDELITQLSQYIAEIAEQKRLQKHQVKAEAKRFVDHIRERSGLLNEQGQDRYAFVHKTFQEYLTAQEIRDRQEEGFEVVLNHIREHLHNSHWREVLLLLIAQQKRSNPKKVIEEILKQDTPYEEWLHRNLFFAGSCLAEDLELSDDSLITKILKPLVELEVSDGDLVGYRIKYQVFQTLCSLNETRFQNLALELLQASADRIDKVRLQEYRAALGEKDQAIAALLSLLQDKDSHVRSRAVYAVGKLGNASPQVVEALLSRLQDENSYVRSRAVYAVGKLGNASPQVVEALLSRLQDENSYVRSRAIEALGKLGNASPQVVEALLSRLQDENSDVRYSAADALGNLGNASPQVVEALLSRLQDEDSDVRFFAADALGKLGNTSPQVVEALLSRLQDENYSVLSRAIEALGKLGNASPQVVEVLLSRLQNENFRVRSRAIEALGNLGNASPQVVEALLSRLQDKNSHVRFSAADALGNLGNASPQVVEALLSRLQDEDSSVRFRAADGLGKLGNASPQVVEVLLSRLQDEEYFVRFRAVDALGKLGNASPQVVEALLSRLQDEDSSVRSLAVDALGKLGNASPQVVEALLSRLQDEDSSVRFSAVYALGKLGKNSSNVAAAVARWISQHQNLKYVGEGIDVLWDLVAGEA